MTVIKADRLKKYYGENRGIENVSFEVNEGEVFGFIGPNGAGKSTTIRTLLGFVKPTGGQAEVLGRDIRSDLHQARQEIGYLPAEVVYYDDMTALQLLQYSAKFYRKSNIERIYQLAQYFELDLKRKIEDLSTGNRKKVGIIQALLHQPKLLILDEPTTGLDPLMQKKFFDLLEEEKVRGTSIFFSSHILSEVQKMCDRIGIIKNGDLIKVEKMAEMQKVQYKKIDIEFSSFPRAEHFKQKDIHQLKIEGLRVSFLYAGDLKPLLAEVSKKDLKNIWIGDPDLEEIFMYYYQ